MKRSGLHATGVGTVGLALVIALLPVLGETDTLAESVSAYVLVLFFTGAFLYGLLVLAANLPVQRLLLAGAFSGIAGIVAAYLGGRPETLVEGSAVLPLALLFFAATLRIGAAACVGVALARRVDSPGIALLIAGLATAADLFSFLAGPTRSLVEGGSEGGLALLGYLLVWFPTFGAPLGFALGVSDFVFLALFTTVSGYLGLSHPLPILILGCAATLLAMFTGLLMETALPALPFIALSFVLANALPLYKSFSEHRNA